MVGESVMAELEIADPNPCQVATASESGGAVRSVSRASMTNGDGEITEEFEMDSPEADTDAQPVFERGPNTVFRFERERGQECPCELVERHGCPVRSVAAENGTLRVSFFAEDLETVRRVVADVQERSDGVCLRQLSHSDEGTAPDPVYVDREAFTDRQREVLRTAFDMGYFSHPKEANATEVAAELDISQTTFAEHLATVQTKLLDRLLDE